MVDKPNKPSICELSADTRILTSLLETVKEGVTVTYEGLNQAIGRDVQGAARSNIRSALRRVQRDHGFVFACVRNVGYKRLNPSEILKIGDSARDQSRRLHKRTMHKLSCVEPARLDKDEIDTYNAHMALHGVMAAIATQKAVRRLTTAVREQENGKLAIGTTLEELKKA